MHDFSQNRLTKADLGPLHPCILLLGHTSGLKVCIERAVTEKIFDEEGLSPLLRWILLLAHFGINIVCSERPVTKKSLDEAELGPYLE